MDRYVLDANVIREDYRLRRNPGRLLLREARHGGIRLLIPQVCLDEAMNLFREDVEEARLKVRKAVRSLRGLGGSYDVADPPPTDDVVDGYREEFRALLDSATAEVLPYPKTDHDAMARRALERRQPFDRLGRNGYRDVLLWESVLAALDDAHPMVLVSRDAGAFGPNRKGPGLAAELADEVEAAGFDRTSVRRISSIAEFTESLPSVPALEVEAEHLIASNAEIREVVRGAMEEEALDYEELSTPLMGLNLTLADWWVHEVVSISAVRVVSARELDNHRVALDLAADIETVLYATAEADEVTQEAEDYAVVEYEGEEAIVSAKRKFDSRYEGLWDRDQGWLAPGHAYSFIAIDDF